MMDNDEVIELIDEDGNEVKFGYEDTLMVDGKEYVVLLPLETDKVEKSVDDADYDEEDDYEEIVILRIEKNEDGEECLVTIDSEIEENKVFDEFFKKREEEFDIEE